MTVKIKFFRGKRGGYSCQFYINRQRYFTSLGTDERKVAEVKAIEYKEQVIRKLKLGAYSLSSLIDDYLYTCEEKTVHADYKFRLELLLKRMGDIPVSDLTKQACRTFYLEITRNKSERTGQLLSENSKRSYLKTYKALMNFAIDDNKLDFNPFNFFKRGQSPRYVKRERDLSKLEISMLLKKLREISQDANRTLLWRQFYYFFFLMCYSGARPKEISHLKWSDFSVVDKKRAQFIVRANISKTGKSRQVEIPRWVWDELSKVREITGYNSSDFVFDMKRRECDVYGGIKWRHLCKEVGITNARIYDIRHSYISHKLRSGVYAVAVAEQVGHSSTQMTLDNYAHSSDADRKKLVANTKKIG